MVRRTFIGFVALLAASASITVGAAPASAASVDPSDVATSVQGLNVAVSWTDGDATGVTGYAVTTVPQSPEVDVPAGASSAVLAGLRPGISYTVRVAAQTASGAGTQVAAPSAVSTQAPGGSYVAVNPARILDTRIGVGAPTGATQLVSLTVLGRGGIPATGVSAVALNVTVNQPMTGGYVTVYPAGVDRPVASNLNFPAGATQANLVVAQVGTGGNVELYSSASAQLIADVSGYYTTTATASPSTGLYHALPPSRLLDTRVGTGGTTGAVGPGKSINLQVTGVGGVPATGVSAVVLNITETASTAASYVTAYPAGTSQPRTSTLDFSAGLTLANRVVVRVGQNGMVTLYNYTGNVQLIADVTGWYTDGADASIGGSYYVALSPHRLVDTRLGIGAPQAPLGQGGVLAVQVAGIDSLPADNVSTPATAAALTVTSTRNTTAMYATVYPSLSARPLASDLDAPPGRTMPNLTLSALGIGGGVEIYNSGGTTDFVVDLSGYYIGDVHVPSSTLTPPAAAVTSVSQGTDGPTSITLAAATPAPHVGQIIAATASDKAPDGVLGQVTSVATDPSGASTAALQPATLQQALGDADIVLAAPLGANDVTSTQTGSQAAVSRPGKLGSINVQQLRARSVAGPNADPPITGSETNQCSGDVSSSVTTTHSFNPTLVFEAHLGHRGFIPSVTATAGISVTQQLGTSITYSGKASCSWNKQLTQYQFKPITFEVGAVPVVIAPVFTLTLSATASGAAQLSASVQQTANAQAGIRFDNGDLSPYSSLTNNITHTGPTLTVANATASVSLTADLEGKLYGLAGPDASLTATLNAKADITKSPWWTLGFTLDAGAALHFKLLFAHVDVSYTFNILTSTVAQASTTGSGTISGRVTDSAGHPLKGAAIWLITDGIPVQGTSTAADGTYTVSTVQPGQYTIEFVGGAATGGISDAAGYVTCYDASRVVTVVPGSTNSGINCALQSGVEIKGTVSDPSGHPIAYNVTAEAQLTNDPNAQVATGWNTTGADGTYDIRALPAGPYEVCFLSKASINRSARFAGYAPQCYNGAQPSTGGTVLTLVGGQVVTGVNARLAPGGAISGRVTDPSGSGLGDVSISIVGEGSTTGSGFDTFQYTPPFGFGTSIDGTYTIGNLDPGTEYRVCFDGADALLGGYGATPAHYGKQCYDHVAESGSPTLVTVTPNGFTDNINATLAKS